MRARGNGNQAPNEMRRRPENPFHWRAKMNASTKPPIPFDCPHCGRPCSVSREHARRPVRCPGCQGIFYFRRKKKYAEPAEPGSPPACRSNVQPPLRPDSPPTQNDPLSILRGPIIAGLHRQRFAVCVLAGIGMLATFLPWVHLPIVGSISGTAGDGWITLALFIPAMVLAWRGQKLQPLIGNARLLAAIPAGLAGLIGLYKMADFNSRMASLPRDNPFAGAVATSVRIGMGLYLLIAASAALVAVAWLLARPPKETQA